MKQHPLHPDFLYGRVIAAFGRQYLICSADGSDLLCFPRGKKSDVACGDYIWYSQQGENTGVIEQIVPRNTLLWRSNSIKEKLIAANVDLAIIVVACEPAFSESLITRCAIACETAKIQLLIVLNKIDIAANLAAAIEQLEVFQQLNYPLLTISAKDDISQLCLQLNGKTSIMIGQSGMGKTTILNRLVPDAQSPTQTISIALGSGKHTTTATKLYSIDKQFCPDAHSYMIDSPGLQEFGLNHLSQAELLNGFREFQHLLGHCRFRDCRHLEQMSADNCAIRAAVNSGTIKPSRYLEYCLLSQLRFRVDHPFQR